MKGFKIVKELKSGDCKGCCFDNGDNEKCGHPKGDNSSQCTSNNTIFVKEVEKGEMKKLIKFGNMKLPKTTMVFNMGSSKDCPSRKNGLCKYAKICYARKPEIIYSAVLPYREKQEKFWLENSAECIYDELRMIIKKKRNKPTLFRYNESGDFHSQKCVEKLDSISSNLLKYHNVVTYGYTARKDLDFENVSFLIKGSNNDAGNHGKTIVVASEDDLQMGFLQCPGDCKVCSLCSAEKPFNIAFIRH